jgi:two-component system, NtrC family, response regulator HydG
MPQPATALIADPTPEGERLAAALRQAGWEVLTARDGAAARRALREGRPDVVVARLSAPRLDGAALLASARAARPLVTAIVVAKEIDAEAESRVHELEAELLVGPLAAGRVLAAARRGLERARLAIRVAELEERLDRRYRTDPLTGVSPAIQRVVDQIRHVAPTRAMVLIEGERGAGKSRVARAIHQGSARRGGPFVRVSLGALGAQAEDAIFGGTSPEFERADQGTLFLDEIDRAAPTLQARLLGAIRGRGDEGTEAGRRADVRILAASERDLAPRARAGQFRLDLLERLGAVRIAVPPLRERREDIPLLVRSFLQEANRAHARRISGVTQGALERLEAYDWPGNVAELRDAVESMVLAAHGRRRLDLSDLPAIFLAGGAVAAPATRALAAGMTVEEAERHLIAATLRHTGGHKPKAAAMLGIGLRTLYRKMRQYRLEPAPVRVPRGRGRPAHPRGRKGR